MGAAAGIIGSVLSSSAQSGQNGNVSQNGSQGQSISNAGSNTPDIKQADVKEAATNKPETEQPDTKESNVNWEEIAKMSQSLAHEGGQSAPVSSNNFSGGQSIANFR